MKLKSALSIILCLVILIASLPVQVFAQNENFISVVIENVDFEGNITTQNDVLLSNGQKLYAPIKFFTEHTLYYYNYSTNTFVRTMQKENSKFGAVILDFNNKTVTVHPVSFQKKTYNLDGLYKYGSDYYLPLHQMLAYLKATVEISGNKIRITNSGYSLADAEYAMGNMPDKMHLLNYSTNDIVDDIFNGDEKLYYYAAVLSYFSSTIFDLRFLKLNCITKLGDKEDYCSFIEKCATNNSVYIQTVTENANVLQHTYNTIKINKSANDLSKDMTELTDLIKSLTNPLGDSLANNEALFFDSKIVNQYASAMEDITTIADYGLKLGSMSEDHFIMLENFKNEKSTKDDYPLFLAAKELSSKFNSNKAKAISSEVAILVIDKAQEYLSDAAAKEITFAALGQAIPVTTMVKGVSAVFKLAFDFDLTDNSDYSIMLDICAKSAMGSIYFNKESVKTVKSSEALRTSAILYLLSCIEVFNSADNLSNKWYETTGTIYGSEKETLNAVLALYYLAVQSKHFDNFEGIEKMVETNQSIISKSGIVKNAPVYTPNSQQAIIPEATNTPDYDTDDDTGTIVRPPEGINPPHLNPGNDSFDNWESAAVDLICNAPDYGFEVSDTNVRIELIDITFDNIPEIFLSCGLGATRVPAISAFFYYNGSKYVKGTMNGTKGSVSGGYGDFPVLPCEDDGKTIFITAHMGSEELPDEIPGYASFWYRGISVSQLNCSGNTVNFTTIANYSEYRQQIEELYYSGEEDKMAEAEEMWESYCTEVEDFSYNHPIDSSHYYLVSDYIDFDYYDAESYKSTVTDDIAVPLVEQYSISV